jgi:glycosyltransferase involved in cell wall biosynthesis
MSPLVSVVVPTYERARTLERAIASVLDQTFSDFELIVVDDGSTDATQRLLGRYAGLRNVRCVSTRHRGCAAARNLGLTLACGRYIAFQDSDDEWLPEKLGKAIAALEREPKAGVFYSDMLRVHADGSCTDFRSPEVQQGALISTTTLDFQVRRIGIQSAVIRRECFDAVGSFDESLPRLIDLELFIRLSDKFGFIHSTEKLVRYYAGAGISTNRQALVTARRCLLRKYRHRLAREPQHLARQYLYLADALRQNGEAWTSFAHTIEAFLIAPGEVSESAHLASAYLVKVPVSVTK